MLLLPLPFLVSRRLRRREDDGKEEEEEEEEEDERPSSPSLFSLRRRLLRLTVPLGGFGKYTTEGGTSAPPPAGTVPETPLTFPPQNSSESRAKYCSASSCGLGESLYAVLFPRPNTSASAPPHPDRSTRTRGPNCICPGGTGGRTAEAHSANPDSRRCATTRSVDGGSAGEKG